MLKKILLTVILLLLFLSVGCTNNTEGDLSVYSSDISSKNYEKSNSSQEISEKIDSAEVSNKNYDLDSIDSIESSPTEISSYTKENDSRVMVQLLAEATSKNVQLKIFNNSNERMTYAPNYVLEKKIDNNWFIINKNQYFNATASVLDANSSQNLNIIFENNLELGYYRIIKRFNIGSEILSCDIEFEVKGE